MENVEIEKYVYGIYAIIALVLLVLFVLYKRVKKKTIPEKLGIIELIKLPDTYYKGECDCSAGKVSLKMHDQHFYCNNCGNMVTRKIITVKRRYARNKG